MNPFLNSILSVILFSLKGTALRLESFYIPDHAIQGEDVQLSCNYDLEGDKLYSVKWYRNGQEFYRYIPSDNPSTAVFSQPGLYIDEFKSTETKIFLKNVDLMTTGLFRCEISGEAPLFPTASQETILIVVDLPDDGPIISGSVPRYHVGDHLNISCISPNSVPAAKLKWFINGEYADSEFVHQYEVESNRFGLQTARQDIRFKITENHLRKGDLKLKCTATIATIYWKSNEESVQIMRKQTQFEKFKSEIWSSDSIMRSISEGSRGHISSTLIISVILAVLLQ